MNKPCENQTDRYCGVCGRFTDEFCEERCGHYRSLFGQINSALSSEDYENYEEDIDPWLIMK